MHRKKRRVESAIELDLPIGNIGEHKLSAKSAEEYTLTIKYLDGAVAFTETVPLRGQTDSHIAEARERALVKILNEERRRRRFDLRDMDLRDLPFEAARDLSRFNLSGSDIRGSSFKNLKLNHTSFNRCRADVLNLSGAKSKSTVSLCGLDIEKLIARGSNLESANLRGSKIGEIHLSQNDDYGPAFWNQPILSQVEIRGGDISKATLHNGDWGNSLCVRVKMHGTHLSDNHKDIINNSLPASSDHFSPHYFPDKSRGSVFVGCSINKETELNGMNRKALTIDNGFTKLAKFNGVLTGTILLVAADSIGLGWLDGIQEGLSVVGCIGIATGIEFLKSAAVNQMDKYVTKPFIEWLIKTRQNAQREGKGLLQRFKDMRVVFGSKENMQPVIHALSVLQKQKASKKSLFKHTISGNGDCILVCDKKHLTHVISHISSNRHRDYAVSRDVTLTRLGANTTNDDAAATLTFHKDGTKTFSWFHDGRTLVGTTDHENNLSHLLDLETGEKVDIPVLKTSPKSEGKPDPKFDTMDAINTFERRLLDDNGLSDFDYDDRLNYVMAGENGKTMFVYRTVDRTLHNDHGPAFVAIRNRTKNPEATHRDGDWVKQHYAAGKFVESDRFRRQNRSNEWSDFSRRDLLDGLSRIKKSLADLRPEPSYSLN